MHRVGVTDALRAAGARSVTVGCTLRVLVADVAATYDVFCGFLTCSIIRSIINVSKVWGSLQIHVQVIGDADHSARDADHPATWIDSSEYIPTQHERSSLFSQRTGTAGDDSGATGGADDPEDEVQGT